MTTKEIGVYVHIPFCVKKCNYCDFCSYPGSLDSHIEEYVKALFREIDSYKEKRKIPASTLYFGGGTPSLLEPNMLERILEKLYSVFDFSRGFEFTLEANPGTVTKEKAFAYRSLGVNRISMGLQSIHEKELKKLGRIHSFDEFIESYKSVRAAGFDNVSVDLMYGLPFQTKESFLSTLKAVTELDPQHISSYGLIVEPGTPFYSERDSLPLPSEDEECDMYYLACDFLAAAGYNHYEISNFAKPTFESRHNLKYWRDEEYIGLGASAYSYYGGKRYGNSRDIFEYVTSPMRVEEEIITPSEESYEYAMMRLRLKEGFSLSDFRERFGYSFLEGKEKIISSFVGNGLVKLSDDRISFTEKGFYLSNNLLTEIL